MGQVFEADHDGFPTTLAPIEWIALMFFGSSEGFAIEVSDAQIYAGYEGVYVSFRFWVSGKPIGDWDACVSLPGSIIGMKEFILFSDHRVDAAFENQTAEEIYDSVYTEFYNYDYRTMSVTDRDLRSMFHMDFIAIDAVQDLYGIVLVAPSWKIARLIVQDQRTSTIIADAKLPFGEVERIGKEYIEWGERHLGSRC